MDIQHFKNTLLLKVIKNTLEAEIDSNQQKINYSQSESMKILFNDRLLAYKKILKIIELH